MNFSQGHSGTKVQFVNRARFPKEKNTRSHTKMGEIHELFVLALFLVWFAGATPDGRPSSRKWPFLTPQIETPTKCRPTWAPPEVSGVQQTPLNQELP